MLGPLEGLAAEGSWDSRAPPRGPTRERRAAQACQELTDLMADEVMRAIRDSLALLASQAVRGPKETWDIRA
jgi:hypothetical protein